MMKAKSPRAQVLAAITRSPAAAAAGGLLVLVLIFTAGGPLSFLNPFHRAQNPFLAVYHDPTPVPATAVSPANSDDTKPLTERKQITYGRNGLPAPDKTCYPAVVPVDPRSQRVLIALEAYCPGLYDQEAEERCNHPGKAFTKPCLKAQLPIEDRRIRVFKSAEMKKLRSTPKGTYKAAYTGFMRRLAPMMEEKGWSNYGWTTYNTTKFWKKAAKADIIILSILNFRNVIRVLPNKRYILVQTNDGATLSYALGCDPEDPRVLGILQHTALNPLTENNLKVLQSRRHFEWLTPNDPQQKYRYRVPNLSDSAISKIHVAIPQIYRWRYPLDCGGNRQFSRMVPAFIEDIKQWIKPFHKRKYDLVFLGTITDNGSRDVGGINDHRRAAVHSIENLKKKYPHLNIFLPHHSHALGHVPYEHFLDILKDTRIFISPYGLGEFSGKDYESMLAGALLVKPAAHKLMSYPNIYGEDMTISADLYFNDLEEKVMPYLERCPGGAGRSACLAKHQEAEQWTHSNLEKLRSFMDLKKMANKWDGLLYSMASREADFECGRCRQGEKWMYNGEGKMLGTEIILEKSKILKKALPSWFAKQFGLDQLDVPVGNVTEDIEEIEDEDNMQDAEEVAELAMAKSLAGDQYQDDS